MNSIDTSTINREELSKLPLAKLAPTYRVDSHRGNGCYLDPPGFPTYFTQNVWTQHGNHPRKGAVLLLDDHVIEQANWNGDTWEERIAKREALMRRLYVPLPFDHPRVQAWVATICGQSANCYSDAERPEHGRPGTLIFPVPDWRLRTPQIDPNWTEEYKAAVRNVADVFNREETARAARIATIDNHRAVIAVRQYYPEWPPTLAEIEERAQSRSGDWWTICAERPTPETCSPERRWTGDRGHRNDGWCQFCGYETEEKG